MKGAMEIYCNGSFRSETEAVLRAAERGFLYGEGLFETLVAYGGEIFRFDAHMQRLRRSADALRILLPLDDDETARILYSLIERNGLSDAYLRLTISSGSAPGMVPDHRDDPTVLGVARELKRYPPGLYERGARVVTSPYYLGPLSAHKTLSFFPYTRARAEARDRGADEALLFDRRGNPAECSASNLFIIKDGTVVTPSLDAGILPGITRAEVIAVCRDNGISLRERTVLLDEVRSADEIFLTNTIMKVLGVASLDDVTLPEARPLTGRIAELYGQLIPQ